MQKRRQLNLFAFPPETDALFEMLIVASITLALFLGNAFVLIFGIADPLSNLDIKTRGLEATRAYLPIVCISSTTALTVLAIAWVFYLRHPYEIHRRRKIESISEKDLAIQQQVNEIAVQSGVAPPTIEMPRQGLRGTDAQAFGIGKSQTIALDGGLRILRKTKPEVFIALLRHELAHFANRDIGKSYFSDALWKSIRWVMILPFVLSLIGNIIIGIYHGVVNGDFVQRFSSIQFHFNSIIQFGFVLAATGLLWIRLLRTREFFADWRAVHWGSQDGLNEIFKEEIEKERPKARFKPFSFHPDAKERLDAIEHPETLYEFSPMMVFLSGLLLSFMFVG